MSVSLPIPFSILVVGLRPAKYRRDRGFRGCWGFIGDKSEKDDRLACCGRADNRTCRVVFASEELRSQCCSGHQGGITFGDLFFRTLHVEPCNPVPGPTVNFWTKLEELQDSYLNKGVAVVDDALRPEVWRSLRRCLLRSTIWFNTKNDGDGTFVSREDVFPQALFEQVGQEMKAVMMAAGLPVRNLRTWWSYKQTAHNARGVGVHSDGEGVTADLFMTPTASNDEPRTGGLRVYQRGIPVGASAVEGGYVDWDATPKAGVARDTYHRLLEQVDFAHTRVGYRENRLIIFDGHLFHENEAPVRFKPGHTNQRTSLTFSYHSGNLRKQLCSKRPSPGYCPFFLPA